MFVAPRKQIRLPPDEYIGRAIYFVTVCSQHRVPIFDQSWRCERAIEELKRVSSAARFLVHAFCIMPDHAHLLVEGQTSGSNLVGFVARWKQTTGYIFRHELPRGFWQRRFYDHILRHAEDSDRVAWYIWMNPVRKGIVAAPQNYPFSGSFTVPWPNTFPQENGWIPPWKEGASLRNYTGTR